MTCIEHMQFYINCGLQGCERFSPLENLHQVFCSQTALFNTLACHKYTLFLLSVGLSVHHGLLLIRAENKIVASEAEYLRSRQRILFLFVNLSTAAIDHYKRSQYLPIQTLDVRVRP